MSLTDFDQGWIIGFIEGEGSFTYDTQGGRAKKNGEKRPIPRLFVTQTCRTPLEFLREFFGGGHIYRRCYEGKAYWDKYKMSPRYDYIVVDVKTLCKIRDFCEGRLKHPFKIKQFERWKTLFANHYSKEECRELARLEMNERWKDPSYRAKVIKGNMKRWTNDEKVKQSERLTQKWIELKAEGKSSL